METFVDIKIVQNFLDKMLKDYEKNYEKIKSFWWFFKRKKQYFLWKKNIHSGLCFYLQATFSKFPKNYKEKEFIINLISKYTNGKLFITTPPSNCRNKKELEKSFAIRILAIRSMIIEVQNLNEKVINQSKTQSC